MAKFLKLIRNEEGATAIEYGLIAALIAIGVATPAFATNYTLWIHGRGGGDCRLRPGRLAGPLRRQQR